MREPARMGLRAVAAAALAMGVTRLLSLPRSYWAVLVAVVVVNETLGESVRMAWQRVAMTALGCVVGALVHAAVAGHATVEEVLLFAGVFLAVYFRRAARAGSYPWMIFFITVYVVFLFAVLGQWSVRGILVTRLVDTAVGSAVALVSSLVVRPPAAGRALRADLRDAWRVVAALVEAPDEASARPLLDRVEALHERRGAISYESLLAGPRRQAAALVEGTRALAHAAVSLSRTVAAARGRALPPWLAEVIERERARTLAALHALVEEGAPGDVETEGAPLCAYYADGCLGRDDFVLAGAILALAEDVRSQAAELREILGRA
jgi:uncharacterized membrane protein YccC